MIKIRRLDAASYDIAQLNHLRAQQTPGSPPKLFTEELADALFQNPSLHVLVALDEEDQDVYLGMACIFIQRIFSGWIAEIHDVVVDGNARGRGIGEKLTKELMSVASRWCVENDVSMKLSLTCRPSRVAANALYKKLGFTMIASSTGPHGTNLYEVSIRQDGLIRGR
jgi:ribosomal protein S18 acetylase RimI-like enzyme